MILKDLLDLSAADAVRMLGPKVYMDWSCHITVSRGRHVTKSRR